ncbi:MAG TPA: ANTAR domain-containing protein [Jatrophihabitantaceae bacterium]|nr:ANTAR domain-containing protein [Jatrophihabitantaceae bacterium]
MNTSVDRVGIVDALVAAARMLDGFDSIDDLAPAACRLATEVVPDVQRAELVRTLSGERSMTLATAGEPEAGRAAELDLPLAAELDDLVLHLYADRALDDANQRTAQLFAAQLAAAVQTVHTRAKAANLERALATSRDIGVAMGIIMARRACTRDQAFDLLRRASRLHQRKLADIASEVAETGILDFELDGRGTGTGRLADVSYTCTNK